MARLQALAVNVRRLPFVRPVVSEVRNATSITERLSAMMEDEDLTEAAQVYEAIGLLPRGTDVRLLLESVLGEQVVGYYDPDESRMVIRDDVMDLLNAGGATAAEPEGILVHELVHALQDQHYNLQGLYDQERTVDADGALRALVEGDATLAMVAHGARRAGDVQTLAVQISGNVPTLEEMMVDTAMPQGGMSLSQAPAIVRATLVVPYLAGLRFCAFWAGQGGWDAIDRHYAQLPQSTEQILHPEKSAAGEMPVAIVLPPLEGLGEVVAEETLGELELAVYLGQGRPSGVDAVAAEGWGGDRLRVYRTGTGPEDTAFVWATMWDTEADAIEVEEAAKRVGRAHGDRHTVTRQGKSVLILGGITARQRGPIIEALGAVARAPTSPDSTR